MSSQRLWFFTSQNPPVVVLNPECDELDLTSSNTHLMHSEVRSNGQYINFNIIVLILWSYSLCVGC